MANACTSKPWPILISRRLRMLSAIARSSGQVTLMFSRLPATSCGLRPICSIAPASSVTTPRARCSACTSSPARNICGVCASQSCARSCVARMRCLPDSSWAAFFTVSATGSARMPPTASAEHSATSACRSCGGRQGRAASCTSIQSSAFALVARGHEAVVDRLAPRLRRRTRAARAARRTRSSPARRNARRRAPARRTRSPPAARKLLASRATASAGPASAAYCFGAFARSPRAAARGGNQGEG